MNKLTYIKALLDKYFEGNTSLEEENQLKRYFQQTDIAEELEVFRPLFGLLVIEKEKGLSDAFDEKVVEKVIKTQKKTKIKRLYYWGTAVAASCLLAVTTWTLYPKIDAEPTSEQLWAKYEIKDPNEAIKITRDALRTVSVQLNRGAAKAADEVELLKQLFNQ